MDTRQVVARVESERQALALMDHPAIAKVFEGGSTAEGRPYFVMEYVPGVSITEHCDTHRLSTVARLKLWPMPQPRPLRFHDLRHTTASLLFMRARTPWRYRSSCDTATCG